MERFRVALEKGGKRERERSRSWKLETAGDIPPEQTDIRLVVVGRAEGGGEDPREIQSVVKTGSAGNARDRT